MNIFRRMGGGEKLVAKPAVDLSTGEAVEETPVPYGGEAVVFDDQPWNFPHFDDARVAQVAQITRERAESGHFRLAGEDSAETFEERLRAVSVEQRISAEKQASSSPKESVVDSPETYDSPRIDRSPEERALYNQVIQRVVADVAKDPQEYWDRIDRAIDTINHAGEGDHESAS